MRRLGAYIALFGIAAIILPYFNRQLYILSWIDNWGEIAAWFIKIGLVVLGTVLFFKAKYSTKNDTKAIEKTAK